MSLVFRFTLVLYVYITKVLEEEGQKDAFNLQELCAENNWLCGTLQLPTIVTMLMVATLEAVLSIDADGQSASVKAVTTYEIYMEEYV